MTRVTSIRLPSNASSALERATANAGWSVARGLDCLLSYSFDHGELVRQLPDCPDTLDAKLDVRIPSATSERLRTKTGELGIAGSVYIRKLLYHLYVTKQLRYVQSGGRYTLAGCHD